MDCMKTNALSQVIISESDMIDVLYTGDNINDLVVDDPVWVKKFNEHCKEFDLPSLINWRVESPLDNDAFIRKNLSNWYLPESYLNFDIEEYLLSKCNTTAQTNRVNKELHEFKSRDMLKVLIWLKYFVDTLRENDLIWGVGRGSSTASYILFLIGVHKIDSLKYEIDIKEFLK